MDPHGTPLAELTFWPRDLVAKLKRAWITTAEQVVATSATRDGIRQLARHLEIWEEELADLVSATRKLLSPETQARLGAPADTSRFGLGAIDPTIPREKK